MVFKKKYRDTVYFIDFYENSYSGAKEFVQENIIDFDDYVEIRDHPISSLGSLYCDYCYDPNLCDDCFPLALDPDEFFDCLGTCRQEQYAFCIACRTERKRARDECYRLLKLHDDNCYKRCRQSDHAHICEERCDAEYLLEKNVCDALP